MKKFRFGFRCILAIFVVIFIVTFQNSVQADSVIDEARYYIKNYYVEPVSDNVLNAATIQEMIKQLNDPYSEYFSKQEQQDFVDSIDNKMCGIGVYIQVVKDGVLVNNVISLSPAEKAGIKSGDIILSANGKSLVGLDSTEASSYIKGSEGTSVKLVIKRNDKEFDFTVERKEISVPTVTGKVLNGHTAYIDITSFGEDTSKLFTEELQNLRMQNPDSYIIDLRNNGGGYMSTALDIAGNFVGKQPAITVEDRSGSRVRYLASDKGSIIDKPVIFLTNKNTASASEILSAAVKDYKKAFFVGSTTYGKGVAQQIFGLTDGSYLKLTVEKFFSPMGNTIQKVGISPDFKVDDDNLSLKVAELLSGKCVKTYDKSGYIKANINGTDFEINLNTAKDDSHWTAFKYIIENVDKSKIYIGTDKGWIKAPEEYFNNIYQFLYSDYKILTASNNNEKNKVFTVTFNKNLDSDSLKDNSKFEIIDANTGERVAFDIKKIAGNKINLVPKNNLQSGETYLVRIFGTLRPFSVK